MPLVSPEVGKRFLITSQQIEVVAREPQEVTPVTATFAGIDLVFMTRDVSLNSKLLACVLETPDEDFILNFVVLRNSGYEILKDVGGGLDTGRTKIYSPLKPISEDLYSLLNEPEVERALRGSISLAYDSWDSDSGKIGVLASWEDCLRLSAYPRLRHAVPVIEATLSELERNHPQRFGL